MRVLFGAGDPLFDLADAFKIFVQLAAVGVAEAFVELGGLPGDQIEHALADGIFAAVGGGVLRAAEHPVEGGARADLFGYRVVGDFHEMVLL